MTYALTPGGTDGRPDLPAGLSFAAATRTVAGTPTGTRAKTTYTFTATDAANNRAGPPGTGAGTGLPVVMEVRADTVPTFGSRASVSWPADARVQTALSVNLPAASGGNGTLTYTLSPAAADGRPALPTGLSYTAPAAEDAHGGTIAGTPTAGIASTTYTLTVTDSDASVSAADADTLRFRIAVTDATPTFGTATIPPQRYTQGVAVTTAALPAASGGEGILAYAVSPGLPSGLTFDAATRVITGTPLTATPAAPYALVATDDEGTTAASDDDCVSLAFTVAVANAPGDVTIVCADPDTATPALEVDEGRSGTCTAVLNARPTGDVTVTPSITHGSPAGDTTDVTRVPSALTFGTDDWFTARTVTLRAGTDADAVNDTATLSFAVGGYGTVMSARAVAVAVRDSETAGLTAAPISLALHSGSTATYMLKLDTQPTAAVTAAVTVDGSGGTAFVSAAPSALTFTGSTWSTAQTVTVAATGVGTVTLTNTAAGGDYAELDTDVAVTVSPDPTLTIGDASVTEGDDGAANLTFTVTLSAASTQQVTVNYAEGTGGTATAGTGYTR